MTKRGHHEGTITKLSSGYRARVSINGKRYSATFPTRPEALAWIREIKGQTEKGLSYDAARTSLADFLAGWLTNKKSSLHPNTHKQYSQVVKTHIEPGLGTIKLKDLRPDHVQALYNRKVEEGTGLRTVELIHSILHNALGQALKMGVVVRNVTDATTPPRAEGKEIQLLSEEESSRLLLSLQGNRLEALFYLAALTGMRKGELLGLQWKDLDWITGEIHIRRQVQHIAGQGKAFSPLKTERSKRTVTIYKQSLELLREHAKRQQQDRLLAGERWQENDMMFSSKIGTPIEPSNFDKAWREVRKMANVHCRFHDLRHLAASVMLVKLKMSPTEVAAALGHSRTSTTLDIYGHLLPGMKPERAQAMEEALIPVRVSNHIGPRLDQEKG